MLALAAVVVAQISVINARPARRIPVTPAHLATAFRDKQVQSLFERARQARLEQDSTLRNYDATVHERVAAGISIGDNGRERALYRYEAAARVQWQLGVGAYIDFTGARVGIPPAGPKAEHNELEHGVMSGEFATVPYFPGYDALWVGRAVGSNQINDRQVVNPLADGAEAYYTYETGESTTYTLSDGKHVQIREIKVRPRSAKWNLAVGSLQVDVASGQVVAAMYRMAAPQDMFASIRDAAPDSAKHVGAGLAVVKTFVPNFETETSEILIENALFEGRFWLPRTRTMRGQASMGSIKSPAVIQQAITYEHINGAGTLPKIVVPVERRIPAPPDSLRGLARRRWLDSATGVRRLTDSVGRDTVLHSPCATNGKRQVAHYDSTAKLAVAVTFPCDIDALTTSTTISKSLYEPDEQLFESAQLDALANHALGLGAQAQMSLSDQPRGRWTYGLAMSRYNRVEGFSSGIGFRQQLGAGYVLNAWNRIGLADHRWHSEFALSRTNLEHTYTLAAYLRLESANDWGRPFSLASSLSALLFGRDDGFYYHARGAELRFKSERGVHLGWKIFAEEEGSAKQNTDFSLGGSFPPNVIADAGKYLGASTRFSFDVGKNPSGLRAFTDVRLEGALARRDVVSATPGTPDGHEMSSYGRGAVDVTIARALPMNLAGALTLAGGTSLGALPAQRHWFLGGTETVRGLRPDPSMSGDAFWLTRAEVGKEHTHVRTSMFLDLGWTGARGQFADRAIRPLSGAGVGFGMLDGLVRLDIAKGLNPNGKVRVTLGLGGRW